MSKEKNTLTIRPEWVILMRDLSSAEFKELFLSIWDYAVDGTDQPEFKGNIKTIANAIFYDLKRKREQSVKGKVNAEKRWKNGTEAQEKPTSLSARKEPQWDPNGTPMGTQWDPNGSPMAPHTTKERESETETEKESEKERSKEKDKEKAKEKGKEIEKSSCLRTRFAPPTAAQVRAYCEERKNLVNAEDFCDFYASKGWRVGKEPMKDWRAAVRLWERRRKEELREKGLPEPAPFDPELHAIFHWGDEDES